MSHMGPKLKSSRRANVFCSSLNNEHQEHSLVPIGRLVAFDHRSGSFVFLKPEFLRVNEDGPQARPTRDLTTPRGLERTHSLMVIGASGHNQISTLATAMSALTPVLRRPVEPAPNALTSSAQAATSEKCPEADVITIQHKRNVR